MLSPTSSINSSDPYEQLIAQIIQLESLPKFRLQDRRAEETAFKEVLSEADSKISALHTLLTDFTAQIDNPFAARTVNNGETDAFTITAGPTADLGTHSLNVVQLARADTRVSARYDSSAGDLRSFFDTNGQQTFNIEVASPTEADPDNRVSIAVTANPTGTTNDEILDEIATAIDTAMDDAVTAGTISASDKALASVIQETSTNSRLSIRSSDTGYTNRIDFTDSANGLLAALEVNAATVMTPGSANGGMITDVGTSEIDSGLNSIIELDGLTLYRSSNSITDALDGVTIKLNQAGGSTTDFTVDSDEEAVKQEVVDFIEKYNELLDHLKGETQVDVETDVRGGLAGEYAFTDLRFGMRDDVVQPVSGQPVGAPTYLTDLGITINEDGTLELSDEEALVAAVEEDATAVQSLFSGTDGVATRLLDRLDRFVGTDGLIDARKAVIDDRISRLDDRIADWDDRLLSREEMLRDQFAQLQETLALFEGQQGLVNSFFLGGGVSLF